MSALASNILFFIALVAIMSAICISVDFWLESVYEKYQRKHRKLRIQKCNKWLEEHDADIRADERAKIKKKFKMYHRLETKFTLNQCKEKDGLYYLDVTELFNGLVDQVLG